MEGLIASSAKDTRPYYGGGNDDDNSGTLSFVSLRYGGQFVGNNVELNGLACGGVGRETIIDHIDVINNLDDGIEVWGGTVNMQYVSIWNVGDDSLDLFVLLGDGKSLAIGGQTEEGLSALAADVSVGVLSHVGGGRAVGALLLELFDFTR